MDTVTNTNQEQNDLRRFHAAFPQAQIVSQVMSDLDHNSIDELVIIFDNTIQSKDQFVTTKSNLCVVTNDDIHALNLAENQPEFQFANGSKSLKILENPSRASILLYNPKLNKNIDFQVTMSYDKKTNQTNFSIRTVE